MGIATPTLQFYKAIVRHRSGEKTLKMLFDEKLIIVLEVMECTKMKANQDSYYFTIGKLARAITAFSAILDV